MSYAESSAQTTLRFINSWGGQNPKRLTAELLSLSRETHRKPDTYFFEMLGGILIDPETKRPVLDFILPGIEYSIAKELQEWANQTNEGIAFWASPRYPEKYPCEKIILHRIAYTLGGRKVVLNSAILFDAKLDNPENLRKRLFTTEDKEETIFKILAWIEKISGESIENRNNPEIIDQAQHFAERIRLGNTSFSIVEEMQKNGFLGQNSISCAGGTNLSFSNFVLERSEVITFSENGKFVRKCGNCGAAIFAVISKGYRCPSCGGIYEGC